MSKEVKKGKINRKDCTISPSQRKARTYSAGLRTRCRSLTIASHIAWITEGATPPAHQILPHGDRGVLLTGCVRSDENMLFTFSHHRFGHTDALLYFPPS